MKILIKAIILPIGLSCWLFATDAALWAASPPPAVAPAPAPSASAESSEKGTANQVTGGGKIANETNQAGSVGKSASKLLRISPGDELSVTIPDLDKRTEKQPNIADTVTLFLDCKPVKDVKGRACMSEKAIVFSLDRDAILQATPGTKVVSVGVGFGSASEQEVVMPEKVQLVLVTYTGWFWLATGLVLAIGLFLILAGRSTNLLRDGGTSGGAGSGSPAGGGNGSLGGYSLAKVQMAWWFFFVASAFLFIWLAVGNIDSLNNSIVILLGISVGTTIASRTVSAAKRSTAEDLNAKQDALQQQVDHLQNQVPKTPDAAAAPAAIALGQDLATKKAQLNQASSQLSQLTIPANQVISRNFLNDIMSDESGISIHRFQMVAWTVILTIIFVREVFTNLSMPQFSDTLLTLMGISSGTYVALKIPEKNSVVT